MTRASKIIRFGVFFTSCARRVTPPSDMHHRTLCRTVLTAEWWFLPPATTCMLMVGTNVVVLSWITLLTSLRVLGTSRAQSWCVLFLSWFLLFFAWWNSVQAIMWRWIYELRTICPIFNYSLSHWTVISLQKCRICFLQDSVYYLWPCALGIREHRSVPPSCPWASFGIDRSVFVGGGGHVEDPRQDR